MTKKLILTRKEKLYLMKIYDLFESGAVVIGATEMAKIFSKGKYPTRDSEGANPRLTDHC